MRSQTKTNFRSPSVKPGDREGSTEESMYKKKPNLISYELDEKTSKTDKYTKSNVKRSTRTSTDTETKNSSLKRTSSVTRSKREQINGNEKKSPINTRGVTSGSSKNEVNPLNQATRPVKEHDLQTNKPTISSKGSSSSGYGVSTKPKDIYSPTIPFDINQSATNNRSTRRHLERNENNTTRQTSDTNQGSRQNSSTPNYGSTSSSLYQPASTNVSPNSFASSYNKPKTGDGVSFFTDKYEKSTGTLIGGTTDRKFLIIDDKGEIFTVLTVTKLC